MRKSFDELTIADDYMFCTVMLSSDRHPCLSDDTEFCVPQNIASVGTTAIHGGFWISLFENRRSRFKAQAKNTRRRAFCTSRTVFCEVTQKMPVYFRKPERMRYYQCAIDNSAINKGGDYNDLLDTFIIFLCTFDYLEKGLPVYTIKPQCLETGQEFSDGTTKIIVNSTASQRAEENLKAFLSYMNGQIPETAFTKKLEEKVNETKEDEEKRREYMLLKSFEMDARRAGIQEGIQAGILQGRQEGIVQGRSEGIAQGSYQKAIETASTFKRLGIDIEKIAEGTGLSVEEIEKL